MDFALSEELEAVRDLAGTILSGQSTPDHLAALEAEGAWLDRSTWQALADAGLLAAPLPAEHGGADLGWLAVHLLLEVIGQRGYLKRDTPGAVLRGRLERAYAGTLILTFGGGTNEIQRDIIAMIGLGMPRAPR